MSKGIFRFFFLFSVLLAGALYFSSTIQSPFLSILNSIKSNYHSSIEFIQKQVVKHLYQAEHIEDLQKKMQTYKKSHLIMQQLQSEIDDLLVENNTTFQTDPKVSLARCLSYQKFGDFNRIWLEVQNYDASRVYGLVYKNLVAGIVVSHEGRALGLLNRDIKSTYAVFIGDEKAPGIAHGNSAQNLIVKFIPAWHGIKEGDEVVTSGLDEIFFKNLKVGKVLSVSSSQGYQTAIVEPYYKANDPDYFHIIEKIR